MVLHEKHHALFEQITLLTDTCFEAAEHIDNCFRREAFNEGHELLAQMAELTEALHQGIRQVAHTGIRVSDHLLACDNIAHSTRQALLAYDRGDVVKMGRITRMEILTSAYALNDRIGYALNIAPYPERVHEYSLSHNETLRNEILKTKDRQYQYDVSILVQAYNQLEYTKQAIESIYEHTDFEKYRIEIITYNNGSTDGTEQYFEAMPHYKKINLKNNIITYPALYNVFEGKYYVGFSNDVVATANWLENLIEGMEARPEVFMAAPVCNEDAISNKQGVKIPYLNEVSEMPKMHSFARAFNQNEPKTWEYVSTVMPFVSIVRNAPYFFTNGPDPAFYLGQFVDDDISTVIRRSGFNMAIARNTFLHHYGSVTFSKKDRAFTDALDKMRTIFFEKWGVDAWESRSTFLEYPDFIKDTPCQEAMKILAVEPLFGGTYFSIINELGKRCSRISADALVSDLRYLEDAQGLFDKVYSDPMPLQAAGQCAASYDLIFLGKYLSNAAPNHEVAFLEALARKLKPGGFILVSVPNMRNLNEMADIITHGAIRNNGRPMLQNYAISKELLIRELEKSPVMGDFNFVDITDAQSRPTALSAKLMALLCKHFSGSVTEQQAEDLFTTVRSTFKIYGLTKPSGGL